MLLSHLFFDGIILNEADFLHDYTTVQFEEYCIIKQFLVIQPLHICFSFPILFYLQLLSALASLPFEVPHALLVYSCT